MAGFEVITYGGFCVIAEDDRTVPCDTCKGEGIAAALRQHC